MHQVRLSDQILITKIQILLLIKSHGQPKSSWILVIEKYAVYQRLVEEKYG